MLSKLSKFILLGSKSKDGFAFYEYSKKWSYFYKK